MLGCYHDLRRDHTAWVQRIHAVLFHQGATVCTDLGTSAGRARLARVVAEQLSPAGRTQVAAAVLMLEATEAQMEVLHRQLLWTARHMAGPKVLVERLYGVGPITGLALTCPATPPPPPNTPDALPNHDAMQRCHHNADHAHGSVSSALLDTFRGHVWIPDPTAVT